ncbi:MAG TPA: peptidylprolyl isomerase [Rhizomicrobium sp.]|jgi:peptidyl-prolyl cis-trans isomerase SurA
MRIATTLLMGATALTLASAASLAQDSAKPAVPSKASRQAALVPTGAQPSTAKTAAPAKTKAEDTGAPPTTDDVAAPTSDAAETTAEPSAATTTASAPAGADAKAGVQEAKNNDAAPQIDAASQSNPDDSDSIAATVNDESISDYEVRQRVALYLATSGINQQLTAAQKTRIRGQILEQLEAEKVQLQEAVKKKITVSPVEVDKRINGMMAENRFDIKQLRITLAAAGASEDALRAQITASIAWQKAVQDEYGDRVNVTPEMVDAELARNAEGANKPHYHVMEIFLPVDNPEQDAKVKKDAEEVLNQLHQGAPFPMVARQFSQHPTAATGGDMGWIHEGQLAPELNADLSKMEPNSISQKPIRSIGGYYILGLRERQEPMGTKIAEAPTGPTGPTGTLPLARLLFPVNPGGPKAEIQQIMTVAAQIAERYGDCDTLDKMHQKMNGTVFMKLGDTKLADLSPQIQKALAGTHPGEAAAPFASEAGIELIARCDKKVVQQTAYVMPTRQQIEDQLFQNQISALARRYLRDLKRDANIQVRDDSKPDALIR